MRNIFILYMPPANMEAMVHYEDTIRKKVNPTSATGAKQGMWLVILLGF
jgi:hypothetical protein